MIDYRLNPLRRGRKAFRDGLQIEANPYHQRLHREWWERGWREVEDERRPQGKEMTWKQRKETMKTVEVLQIERPAKAYSCDACGSRDPHCKACAKAREAAEKYYEGNEKARQRNIKHRAIRNAPVENIEESKSKKNLEMPTEEEADKAEQADLYDMAVRVWERMTQETRQRFVADARPAVEEVISYMKGGRPVITGIVPNEAPDNILSPREAARKAVEEFRKEKQRALIVEDPGSPNPIEQV